MAMMPENGGRTVMRALGFSPEWNLGHLLIVMTIVASVGATILAIRASDLRVLEGIEHQVSAMKTRNAMAEDDAQAFRNEMRASVSNLNSEIQQMRLNLSRR